MYENSAVCSSCVGLSGNFAMVVCITFHAARPSSAFKVSLPILPVMTSPFNTSLSTWTGWMGTELNDALGRFCREKTRLMRDTRPSAAMSKVRKRLLGTAPEGGGILGDGMRQV